MAPTTKKQRLHNWLRDHINTGKCRQISWINRRDGTFQIRWVNKKKVLEWTPECAELFKEYAIHKGHFKPGETPDYPKFKQNFKSALDKSKKYIKRLHVNEDKSYRVYKFLNWPSEDGQTSRRNGHQSEEQTDWLDGQEVGNFEFGINPGLNYFSMLGQDSLTLTIENNADSGLNSSQETTSSLEIISSRETTSSHETSLSQKLSLSHKTAMYHDTTSTQEATSSQETALFLFNGTKSAACKFGSFDSDSGNTDIEFGSFDSVSGNTDIEFGNFDSVNGTTDKEFGSFDSVSGNTDREFGSSVSNVSIANQKDDFISTIGIDKLKIGENFFPSKLVEITEMECQDILSKISSEESKIRPASGPQMMLSLSRKPQNLLTFDSPMDIFQPEITNENKQENDRSKFITASNHHSAESSSGTSVTVPNSNSITANNRNSAESSSATFAPTVIIPNSNSITANNHNSAESSSATFAPTVIIPNSNSITENNHNSAVSSSGTFVQTVIIPNSNSITANNHNSVWSSFATSKPTATVSPLGIEITVTYGKPDRVVLHKTVTNECCRIFFGTIGHKRNQQEIYERDKIDNSLLIELPKAEESNFNPKFFININKILQRMERGLLLICREGNIFVVRRCQPNIFLSDGVSTSLKLPLSDFKEKHEEVEAFNFKSFEKSVNDYENDKEKNVILRDHFLLTFGWEIVPNDENPTKYVPLFIKVKHRQAELLRSKALESGVSNEPKCSMSDSFDTSRTLCILVE